VGCQDSAVVTFCSSPADPIGTQREFPPTLDKAEKRGKVFRLKQGSQLNSREEVVARFCRFPALAFFEWGAAYMCQRASSEVFHTRFIHCFDDSVEIGHSYVPAVPPGLT
jgi:hypothetical protein